MKLSSAHFDDVHDIFGGFVQAVRMVVKVVQLALFRELEDDVGFLAHGFEAEKVLDFGI